MKPFFIKIPNFWAWADKFWGVCSILGQFISTHFVTVRPLSIFSINQLSLYIQILNIIWDWDLNLGPQRYRDLAIVCP